MNTFHHPAATNRFWRDPALPFVESRYASDSAACYTPHTHPTLSIGAIDSGHIVMSLGAQRIPLQSGCLVIVEPHQVHACNATNGGPWSYQMLYLDAAWARQVFAESGAPAELALPPALRQPASYQAYCRLNALLFSPASADEKEAALIAFLGDLLVACLPLASAAKPNTATPDLAALKTLLSEHCDRPWPLAELAARAGLSRYQLIRAFRADSGMTPHAWLLDARINRAKQLLRAGQPLAEVAHQLHFADQSHFQRVFKERVAATPKAYSRPESQAQRGVQSSALFFKT
jgi:AraC-like DNA-binding protein